VVRAWYTIDELIFILPISSFQLSRILLMPNANNKFNHNPEP